MAVAAGLLRLDVERYAMAHLELDTRSYWSATSSISRYPALDRNLTVDVAIVGGGITGLTAAYLLKRAGHSVALIDRSRCGGVDSSLTTAHVTAVTDLDLTHLVDTFGRDSAWAVWDAGLAAIDQIDRIIRREEIECEWSWVNGYKHASLEGGGDERDALRKEAELACELGFDATYRDEVPYFGLPGVEYAGQAKFHPRKYLSALAKIVDGDGSHVFEHTECTEVCDDPLSVKAGDHTISCGYVVIATHTPLTGKTNVASALLFQTKLYLYTSYVLGGRLPVGAIPEASFWDTSDPYYYLRIDPHRGYDYAIFGGRDHKTGQADDTERCYGELERIARRVMPSLEVTHRWSGQVVETNDGLPFIGETSDRQFAATGFSGNGMTFGTLAGLMAHDTVIGRRNPWRELFDPSRKKLRGGAWDYIKENVDYPYYLIRDRVLGPEGKSLRSIPRGEGRVIESDGQRIAAYRSDAGVLTLLSPTCTHMGCQVAWNAAERTWDCPCHGSRFEPRGAVLAGPAESPLERIER
jgi:glycine/D-amino acid oxidase-like deaminating enzyme/nitrite reductase/ring-hydroxylating ferredoxin subunit